MKAQSDSERCADEQVTDPWHSAPTWEWVLPPWLLEIIHREGRLTLTDHEAARLLGLSRGSVRAAIAADEIEVVHLGRRLLILLIPLLKTMGVEILPDVEPLRPAAGEDPTRSMSGLS